MSAHVKESIPTVDAHGWMFVLELEGGLRRFERIFGTAFDMNHNFFVLQEELN